MTKARTLADNFAADINGITAGTGLSGGGTSGTVTLTNDMATTIAAKGDLVAGTANDTYAALTAGTNEQRLVADSAQAAGLKYVADTTNYAVAAKGDLLAGTAADTIAALGVGANGTVLTAASGEATGLIWAAPSSGSMTLLNTGGTTLSGAFVEITSIPGTYQQLYIVVNNYLPATDNVALRMRTNISANNYASINQGDSQGLTGSDGSWSIIPGSDDTVTKSIFAGYIPDYANTTTYKFVFPFMGVSTDATTTTTFNYDAGRFKVLNNTAAVTSLRFFANSGNMTSGTVFVYGVK